MTCGIPGCNEPSVATLIEQDAEDVPLCAFHMQELEGEAAGDLLEQIELSRIAARRMN